MLFVSITIIIIIVVIIIDYQYIIVKMECFFIIIVQLLQNWGIKLYYDCVLLFSVFG